MNKGQANAKLRYWWTDDPNDPGRMLLTNSHVRQLVQQIGDVSNAVDLGGVMSLNVLLDQANFVLRVHQPFVSRQRLLSLQAMRQFLARAGLTVATALPWQGQTVFRCQDRWAELEEFLPNKRLPHTLDSYEWLFANLGLLHRFTVKYKQPVTRPLVATYAPPASMKRWVSVTQHAVREDPQTKEMAFRLKKMCGQLQQGWVPSKDLPVQLIHGDARLSNIRLGEDDKPIFLDFGFSAMRPCVHDIAYALAFMYFGLKGNQTPATFDWACVPDLVKRYETEAGKPLSMNEWRALPMHMASVALYAASLDGFTENPIEKLKSRVGFLELGQWLLDNKRIFGK